jgi:hypothetical protein
MCVKEKWAKNGSVLENDCANLKEGLLCHWSLWHLIAEIFHILHISSFPLKIIFKDHL